MDNTLVLDPKVESLKNTAWWLYLFHCVDLLVALGLFSWIPLIISYVLRPNAEGTFVYSHHTWQIRSFWYYFAMAAVGWLFFLTIIGIPLAYLIWAIAWIWKAYRLIRGIATIRKNQPMPV